MLRLHVSLTVRDLDSAEKFYAALFDTPPSVRRQDYAKWLLDDPRINFVLEAGEGEEGTVTHMGLQADTPEDLAALRDRVKTAAGPTFHIGATQCCYAKSEKSWTRDPAGFPWEVFLTHEITEDFGVSDFQQWAEAAAASPTAVENTKPCC